MYPSPPTALGTCSVGHLLENVFPGFSRKHVFHWVFKNIFKNQENARERVCIGGDQTSDANGRNQENVSGSASVGTRLLMRMGGSVSFEQRGFSPGSFSRAER